MATETANELLSTGKHNRGPSNWFDRGAHWMELHIKELKLGAYAVGTVGLLIAMRSVRPLSKFVKPSSVPDDFVKRHVPLYGTVKRMDAMSNSPLLYVDHRPAFLPRISFRKGELPVQLSGVSVVPNGTSWMTHIVVGKNVKFVPVDKSASSVTAIVYKQAKDGKTEKTDVATQLVKFGFAYASPFAQHLDKDVVYRKHYKQLLSEEKRAEALGEGLWREGYKPSIAAMTAHTCNGVSNLFAAVGRRLKRRKSS